MAGANDNAARIARSAALTLVISVAVLYLGDRFGMLLELYDRPFLDCYMEVMAALPAHIAASPLSFSFETVPLLYGCGLAIPRGRGGGQRPLGHPQGGRGVQKRR